jgi:hypothetical protein
MSPSRSLNEDIQQHYARSDLGTAILAALADAGKDVNHLKPEDLANGGQNQRSPELLNLPVPGAPSTRTRNKNCDALSRAKRGTFARLTPEHGRKPQRTKPSARSFPGRARRLSLPSFLCRNQGSRNALLFAKSSILLARD